MTNRSFLKHHDHSRDDNDCPMTRECVERLLSKIDSQAEQLSKLVSTVSEIRDFYIIIKAIMPIIKYVMLAGTFIGFLIIYYLATGELPVKQIIDILLKVTGWPGYSYG